MLTIYLFQINDLKFVKIMLWHRQAYNWGKNKANDFKIHFNSTSSSSVEIKRHVDEPFHHDVKLVEPEIIKIVSPSLELSYLGKRSYVSLINTS